MEKEKLFEELRRYGKMIHDREGENEGGCWRWTVWEYNGMRFQTYQVNGELISVI